MDISRHKATKETCFRSLCYALLFVCDSFGFLFFFVFVWHDSFCFSLCMSLEPPAFADVCTVVSIESLCFLWSDVGNHVSSHAASTNVLLFLDIPLYCCLYKVVLT